MSTKPKRMESMPGPFEIPILGTYWIYSFFGPYSFETMYQDKRGNAISIQIKIKTSYFYRYFDFFCIFN